MTILIQIGTPGEEIWGYEVFMSEKEAETHKRFYKTIEDKEKNLGFQARSMDGTHILLADIHDTRYSERLIGARINPQEADRILYQAARSYAIQRAFGNGDDELNDLTMHGKEKGSVIKLDDFNDDGLLFSQNYSKEE